MEECFKIFIVAYIIFFMKNIFCRWKGIKAGTYFRERIKYYTGRRNNSRIVSKNYVHFYEWFLFIKILFHLVLPNKFWWFIFICFILNVKKYTI